MVEDRITDGRRIAQLLASELDGREDELAAFSVVEADRDVEPTEAGARAYRVARNGETVATAYLHPDRVRIEFETDPGSAADAAGEVDLRVRPKATDPPRTVLFVESGAEVKRAADVFAALGGSGSVEASNSSEDDT